MHKLSIDNQDKSAVREFDRRQHPRYALDVNIKVETRTCGVVMGDTVDVSETGISAALTEQIPLGEIVRLHFKLSRVQVAVDASVCQRRAFRYCFQYLGLESTKHMIGFACRQLAVNEILGSIESM
jgi:hypothetical protein